MAVQEDVLGSTGGHPSAKILLIGAGGHARVCLEALRDGHPGAQFAAVSRDGSSIHGLGIPMIGSDLDLRLATQRGHTTTAHVAIGGNREREDATRRWLDVGGSLVDAVSRYAMVSSSATWDPGVALLPGAAVNAGTHLGSCVIVNTNASVDHDGVIGSFTHVGPGAAIAGGVTIGERVLIGVGASVLPGVTIGDDAVVGAGSVVIADVPTGSVVVGVPARPTR